MAARLHLVLPNAKILQMKKPVIISAMLPEPVIVLNIGQALALKLRILMLKLQLCNKISSSFPLVVIPGMLLNRMLA
jgi:hypothetical protein